MKAMGKGSLSSFLTVLLSVGWYAVAILLALAVCLLAVTPWVDPPRVEVGLAIPVAMRMNPDTHGIAAPSLGVEAAHIQDVRGSLRFSPRSKPIVAAFAVVLIAGLAFILYVLGQLGAVFRTLRDGHPFVPANATRIRRIGWVLILGEVARSSLAYVGNYYAMTRFSAQGLYLEARPDLNIFAIICGVIILVIAEVFMTGARLDEDQSLTV